MSISAISLAILVGIVCIGLGRLSASSSRSVRGKERAPRLARIGSPKQHLSLNQQQLREAMLVERELAKLMATLSAAAIAALVAMGQAKMIGTFMMTIAMTGLLLALVGSLGVFSRHHAMALNPDGRQKLQRRATTLLNRVRVTMIWTFVLIAYAATARMAKCDRSLALPWLVTETMCSQVAEVLRG